MTAETKLDAAECEHEYIVVNAQGDDLCRECGLLFYYCAPCSDASENAVRHATPLCEYEESR